MEAVPFNVILLVGNVIVCGEPALATGGLGVIMLPRLYLSIHSYTFIPSSL